MGMPTAPILDIMRRSMMNLGFVEAHASPAGPYEVTQLINTFLGALVHPFESMQEDDLMSGPIANAIALGWPAIGRARPNDLELASLGELIRAMRNAMAHGNLEFFPDTKGQIQAIHLWNNNRGRRTWGGIVTVQDMRRFLVSFVDLVERRHRDVGWYARRVG